MVSSFVFQLLFEYSSGGGDCLISVLPRLLGACRGKKNVDWELIERVFEVKTKTKSQGQEKYLDQKVFLDQQYQIILMSGTSSRIFWFLDLF